jgi:hypothetical protein
MIRAVEVPFSAAMPPLAAGLDKPKPILKLLASADELAQMRVTSRSQYV